MTFNGYLSRLWKKSMESLDFCINCGEQSHQMHHVIPKSLGGKEGTNLVPLCVDCHNLVHDTSCLTLRSLQRTGIERAKKEGKYTGRKRSISRLEICYWNSQGLSTYKIAKVMKISRMTVHRCLNKEKLGKVKVKLKGEANE